jgi:glycine/D-amino acid oxidase-like deaminating enzyme
MIGAADVVVIGSGALGSSVAYHLAKAGKRSIALLDQHEIASQTSPRAAGLTSQIRKSALMTRIAMMAVEKIERFEEETGEPLVYYQPGALKIARTPAHEAQLKAEVERGRRFGLELELISPAEAKRKMPFLETSGIRAVTYSPRDLYLEPGQIPRGYARAAEKLGAMILPHTRVTGISLKNNEVRRVLTDKGAIDTAVVIDAAGAWTRFVGSMAGARIAMIPTRHQLLITEPIPGVDASQPITRIIDANVYVRPDNGGLMLGGYEADPLQYDMRNLAADFQIADMPLDIGVLRRLADRVVEQFPVFREWKLREHRGGLPTITADDTQTVGPVPGVAGLFVAGGCCVGGLSISPAIGELLAEWIISGHPPMDLSPLAPGRPGSDLEPEERLKEACRVQYAHHYWEEKPR